MKVYSPAQKDEAKNTDLIDFLKYTEGFDFKKIGKNYRCIQHDSLIVTEDRKGFFWNSKGINGNNAIDWQMKIKGNTFPQAMEKIVGEPKATYEYGLLKKSQNENIHQTVFEKKPFNLPPKSESNNRVLAYLIKTRGIDQNIVKELIKQGKVYQDTRNNAVFVGFDNNGIAAYAFKRSTFTLGDGSKFRGEESGSNKDFSFKIVGADKSKVYCFESPIDLCSKATIDQMSGKNSFGKNTLISLGGVSDNALEKFLETNSSVKEIVFCLDNDEAGRKATEKLSQKYIEKGYDVKTVTPKLKDFNEDLVAMKKQIAAESTENTDKKLSGIVRV